MLHIQDYNIVTRVRPYLCVASRLTRPLILTVGRVPSEWRRQLAETDHSGEQQRIHPHIQAELAGPKSRLVVACDARRAGVSLLVHTSRQRREAG